MRNKSKYTKEEMVKLLSSLAEHLSGHTADFPGISKSVIALSNAAKALMTGKAPSKPKTTKPVELNYAGENLLVKTPWGQAGKALAHMFKVIVGKRSRSINPETGQPYFLSCFDKKAKAFRIPKEKEAEVLKAIEESGLEVVVNA